MTKASTRRGVDNSFLSGKFGEINSKESIMRKYILFNALTAIALQIVNIIVNLVLPKQIIIAFGSEVNGLIQSITQFLSVISFAECGVGAVLQSALYKPLVDKKSTTVSRIVTAGTSFYQKIAYGLAVYAVVLAVIFPVLGEKKFDWAYTAILVLIISANTFAQYYFGIVNTLLLNADLKGYIPSLLQIVVLILSTALSVILIRLGCSIQIVKLVASCVFIIKPIFLKVYVKRKYSINYHEEYDTDPIPSKWDGIAQHISAVVIDHTDIIVLTLFSTLENVSIYSVYHMIVFGIRTFYNSLTSGLQSAFGHLWAMEDKALLYKKFSELEVGCHLITTALFSCTGVLIIPFVRVYTEAMTDAEYVYPLFAFLMCGARAVQCLRTPYNIMILASGHYKQTKRCYIVAAIINVVSSVCLVFTFGLIGVAIGTIVSLFYQTIWMAVYDYKELIIRKFIYFVKQLAADLTLCILIVLACSPIQLNSISYYSWIIMALKVGVISLLCMLFVGLIFYFNDVKEIAQTVCERLKKRQHKG